MHGLIQSQPVGPGPSSRHRIPNQWGITHIYTIMLRTDCHTKLFSPLTSVKTPCFYQKLSPKVLYFFHPVQNFGHFSLKGPKSAGIWEQKLMPPILMAFVTERPLFLALHAHVWEECCSLKHGPAGAGKLCILETESCNLVNTFRCKLNQGDENKISVLQAQPTHLYIMDELHWRAGLIHRSSSLQSNTEGDISYNHPLYDCVQLGSLNKCQVFLRLCKRRHFKCKVQCRACWRARENFEI